MALHNKPAASRKKRPVSAGKAKKILRHGKVRGKSLSKKQKGLFGAIAGGTRRK